MFLRGTDADDYDVDAPITTTKSNWDDEEEVSSDEEVKPAAASAASTTTDPSAPIRPKKLAKMRMAERAKAEEEARAKARAALEANPELDDPVAEKQRRQKLVEDADLETAADLFGDLSVKSEAVEADEESIDAANPKTKLDFDNMAKLCARKFKKSATSKYYVSFLEDLVRASVVGLKAEDIKRLSSTLATMSNEASRLEKQANQKGKKKNTKATLRGGKSTSAMDDFSDFM